MLKVIICLSICFAAWGNAEDVTPAFICDRELVELLLQFKAKCCDNKWAHQVFLEALRPQISEIVDANWLSMGAKIAEGDLNKDVEVDQEKVEEMAKMLACTERLLENNNAAMIIENACDKEIEASRNENEKATQSKLCCIVRNIVQNCPGLRADLTGDYASLANMDNFAYK